MESVPSQSGSSLIRPASVAPLGPLQRRAGALSAALDWLGDQVVLFRAGNLVFVSQGLFAGVGTLLTGSWMAAILVGQGLPPEQFAALLLGGGAVVVFGSWLLAQLLDLGALIKSPWAALRRPVFVSWGGILGIPLLFAAFSWVSGFSLLLLLDAMARTAGLGHALGRLGCLSYGCCYGRPTLGRLAITYRNPLAKAARIAGLRGVPLHPAPLYECLLDLGLIVVTNAVAVLGAPLGLPAALGLLIYGIGRFAVEFLRNDDDRILLGRLSLNQLIAAGMALVGALSLWPLWVGALPSLSIDGPAVLAAARELLPPVLLCSALVFVGFGIHRREVGRW